MRTRFQTHRGTASTRSQSDAPLWFRYIIDAAGQKLGRLATLAATYVRGKHSPTYSPSMDMGAMLVVINAEQVIMSGDKMEQKTYMRHVNGKPGSYTIESFKNLQARIPERIVEKAVYGMLPKGRLGRRIRLNMKVCLPIRYILYVVLIPKVVKRVGGCRQCRYACSVVFEACQCSLNRSQSVMLFTMKAIRSTPPTPAAVQCFWYFHTSNYSRLLVVCCSQLENWSSLNATVAHTTDFTLHCSTAAGAAAVV